MGQKLVIRMSSAAGIRKIQPVRLWRFDGAIRFFRPGVVAAASSSGST